MRGWWCLPDDAAAAAILYLHGGAYGVGSARAYQHFVGQVAARAKVAAFVPEYGLAPASFSSGGERCTEAHMRDEATTYIRTHIAGAGADCQ